MIGAWILAGGRSRRFGSDKAGFLVDGEPLLERTARVCGELGLPVVVVARHVRPGGLFTLIEPDGPRHPLWGVARALAEAAARGHRYGLMVPVDLPELQAASLERLLAGPRAAYAADQRLLAVLPTSAAQTAAAHAAAGASVRDFLAAIAATPVDLGALRNLNRPPAPPSRALR